MHTLTASAQIAVVDQVEFAGAGSPSSIVLDHEALDRARLLGAHVGEQLGRAFEEAEYRGEPGACPVCHLSVVALAAAIGSSARRAVPAARSGWWRVRPSSRSTLRAWRSR